MQACRARSRSSSDVAHVGRRGGLGRRPRRARPRPRLGTRGALGAPPSSAVPRFSRVRGRRRLRGADRERNDERLTCRFGHCAGLGDDLRPAPARQARARPAPPRARLLQQLAAVPRLRTGLASAAERTRFLRAAGVELALMVAIVGVTAVLVSEPPARPRSLLGGRTQQPRRSDELELNLVVDPATAGKPDPALPDRPLRTTHRTSTRRPSRPRLQAAGSAHCASRHIALGPGHFIVHGAQLPSPATGSSASRRAKASSTRPTRPSRYRSGRTPTDMKKTLTLLMIGGALLSACRPRAHT